MHNTTGKCSTMIITLDYDHCVPSLFFRSSTMILRARAFSVRSWGQRSSFFNRQWQFISVFRAVDGSISEKSSGLISSFMRPKNELPGTPRCDNSVMICLLRFSETATQNYYIFDNKCFREHVSGVHAVSVDRYSTGPTSNFVRPMLSCKRHIGDDWRRQLLIMLKLKVKDEHL